jgi:hypothetical protein
MVLMPQVQILCNSRVQMKFKFRQERQRLEYAAPTVLSASARSHYIHQTVSIRRQFSSTLPSR